MKPLAIALPILLIALAGDLSAQRRGTRGRGGSGPPRTEVPPPDAPPAAKVANWTAIVGGDVHIGDGRVLRGATVLLGDDKIHAVGHDIEIPEKATILDAKGRTVTPGFVAVRAQGLGLPSSVTGEIRDAVNPFDPNMKRALAAGITSYMFTSGNGQATPGGTSALIKLAFGDIDGMVRSDKCASSMRVPLSAPEWRRLRELIDLAKEHKAKPQSATPATGGQRGSAGSPSGSPAGSPAAASAGAGAAPAGTEELLRILRGEAILWVRLEAGGGGRGGGGGADDLDEIRQALQIAHLLGRGVVLDDPITAWVVPDEIAATDSAVVLNPRNDSPGPHEPRAHRSQRRRAGHPGGRRSAGRRHLPVGPIRRRAAGHRWHPRPGPQRAPGGRGVRRARRASRPRRPADAHDRRRARDRRAGDGGVPRGGQGR